MAKLFDCFIFNGKMGYKTADDGNKKSSSVLSGGSK